jgi:hypothetical protein
VPDGASRERDAGAAPSGRVAIDRWLATEPVSASEILSLHAAEPLVLGEVCHELVRRQGRHRDRWRIRTRGAIAKQRAARGANVVVSDINLKGAEPVLREITESGGTASAFQHDTAKAEDADRVVRFAVDTYGALHYAVNNAGSVARTLLLLRLSVCCPARCGGAVRLPPGSRGVEGVRPQR